MDLNNDEGIGTPKVGKLPKDPKNLDKKALDNKKAEAFKKLKK